MEEEIGKLLEERVMQGKWEDVEVICSENPRLCGRRIAGGGNTTLHVAVSDHQERTVQQLVGIIVTEVMDVKEMKNWLGNTPLHLAAIAGNVSMCKCLSGSSLGFVSVGNEEGETPLFLAARHGMMDAFDYLLSRETTLEHAKIRNRKGDTILHCALQRGHLKLAFQIIKRCPELPGYRNEEGLTPLHVLASRPGAFRSGIYLSLFDKLIYHCVPTPVVPWNIAGDDADRTSPKTTAHDVSVPQSNVPAEAPQQHVADIPEEVYEGSSGPPNYDTCFSFMSLLKKLIRGIPFFGMVILFCCICLREAIRGVLFFFGVNYIQKIKKKKETNFWSLHVLTQLLQEEQGQHLRYEDIYRGGRNPSSGSSRVFLFDEAGEMVNRPKGEEGGPPTVLGRKDSGQRQTPSSGLSFSFGTETLQKLTEVMETINESLSKVNKWMDGGFYEFLSVIKSHPKVRKGQNFFRVSVEKVSGIFKRVINDSDMEDNLISLVVRIFRETYSEVCREWLRKPHSIERVPTPILLAAKNGITEMLEKILAVHPMAIHDTDNKGKNVLLLAVENRHPHVYHFLLKRNIARDSLFGAVDRDGCSALHLAAKYSDHRTSFIPGAALQMQWEILWFQYVRRSMPQDFFPTHNNTNQTAMQIFIGQHAYLREKGKEWLKDTATSCSVVATLIATVAFATSTAIPGGTSEGSGKPMLEKQPAFRIYGMASLISLAFSVTSTIMFVSILTSRHRERDFERGLPRKLLMGLTALFISILSVLVTFCAGHFFLLQDELRVAALPVYALTCLPASFFALAQLPLYVDLIWATFSRVPQRWQTKDD